MVFAAHIHIYQLVSLLLHTLKKKGIIAYRERELTFRAAQHRRMVFNLYCRS